MCAGLFHMQHSLAGTYAEYICVNDDQLARMPDSMSYEDAAALPLGDADCMAGDWTYCVTQLPVVECNDLILWHFD